MNQNELSFPSSDLLKTFVAIAECRNLTHAADRLNRTQSAISVQLRKLEEAMNVPLFDRHARGMELSENGQKLLPVARRALSELHKAGTLFNDPLHGQIRIGIPDDFEDTILERTLARFKARHPDVDVVTWSGCTSHYPTAVERGELDIAVCSGPDGTPGTPLSVEQTVWAAATDFVLDDDAPVPLAILDRSCWWRDLPIQALDSDGRAWTVAYRSASFASIRSAIRAGLAIAPLGMSSMEPGMRVLGQKDGFPKLPSSKRAIMIAKNAPRTLADAMADAIVGAL